MAWVFADGDFLYGIDHDGKLWWRKRIIQGDGTVWHSPWALVDSE
jgi:hypothetical protein